MNTEQWNRVRGMSIVKVELLCEGQYAGIQKQTLLDDASTAVSLKGFKSLKQRWESWGMDTSFTKIIQALERLSLFLFVCFVILFLQRVVCSLNCEQSCIRLWHRFLSLFPFVGNSYRISPELRLFVISFPVLLTSQVFAPPHTITPVAQPTLQPFQNWESKVTTSALPSQLLFLGSFHFQLHFFFQLLSQSSNPLLKQNITFEEEKEKKHSIICEPSRGYLSNISPNKNFMAS